MQTNNFLFAVLILATGSLEVFAATWRLEIVLPTKEVKNYAVPDEVWNVPVGVSKQGATNAFSCSVGKEEKPDGKTIARRIGCGFRASDPPTVMRMLTTPVICAKGLPNFSMLTLEEWKEGTFKPGDHFYKITLSCTP